MHLKKITLAGVGLLGGSIGLAARRARLADRVVGYVRREESKLECLRLGVVDDATIDLSNAVSGASLIVLCTPVATILDLGKAVARHVTPGTIVTDVGSVKEVLVRELEPIFAKAGAQFVGSHPMAGAERTGAVAAQVDLFAGKLCVCTPTTKTNSEALKIVEKFWEALGARTLRLPAHTHDDLVSRSSHLPHVVAAGLANYVLSPAHPKEQALLCANGFRDTTRVASGSPEMWRDIAAANRKNLSRVLGVLIEDLQEFQLALDNEDWAAVEEFFLNAQQRRDGWANGDARRA